MIVPSINLNQLESLDQLESFSRNWSLLGQLAWVGVTDKHFPIVKAALKTVGGSVDVLVELGEFDEALAIELLNHGAMSVLVAPDVSETNRLPLERMKVLQNDASPDEAIPKGHLLVTDQPTANRLAELEMARVDCLVDVSQLSTEMLVDFFRQVLVTDREDGLWATVIVDSLGIALGLAYSNEESLAHAIEDRVGAYWSRSRGELWIKGATSGATQRLLNIRMDCDRDCLRFMVTQDQPGFCHRETYSCFGQERTIMSVIHRLESRMNDGEAQSFTKKLAADPALLKTKLIEEANELLEASESDRPQEVAWEAADVLYFSLVAMLKKGVSLDAVYQELARRMTRVVRRGPGVKEQLESDQGDEVPTSSAEDPTYDIVAATEFEPGKIATSLDRETLEGAQKIVDAVAEQGEPAIRRFAEQFHEREPGQPLLISRKEMEAAIGRIESSDVALLKRVAERIELFAASQLDCLDELEVDVPGGIAGHTTEPVSRAGCYAPAGNFALPSTVLMTCIPAVVAGCKNVTLATPNPSDLMLAAAAIAGADEVLAIGGAHAIAAMAYGFEGFESCDVIVGPGNRWVTAAKKIVSGDVGIDMLAGPSELVLVADASADAGTIAADLLAQAEHDTDARPFLVTTCHDVAVAVERELTRQLGELPTAEIARQSLKNGCAIVCESMDVAIEVCNSLAPEHLELHCAEPDVAAQKIQNAGCVFIGKSSAEVFGDYGAGPNHTLPTSGTSRFSAGLNVFSFIRVRTFLKIDEPPVDLIADTARLAELEGLIGHQRSSLKRAKTNGS